MASRIIVQGCDALQVERDKIAEERDALEQRSVGQLGVGDQWWKLIADRICFGFWIPWTSFLDEVWLLHSFGKHGRRRIEGVLAEMEYIKEVHRKIESSYSFLFLKKTYTFQKCPTNCSWAFCRKQALMKSPLPEEKLLRRLMRTSLLTNDTKRKDVGRWWHFLIQMARQRTNGIADWRRLQAFESLELLPISCIGYIVLVSQIPASRCNSARSKISWMNCKTSTTMRRTDFKSMQVAVLLCGGSRAGVPWAPAGNTCQATQGGGWYVIYSDIIGLLLILFSIQFPQVPHFLTTDHQTVNSIVFSNTFCHVRQCNRNLPLPKMLWMQPLLALEVGWNLKFTSHHFMTTSKGWW